MKMNLDAEQALEDRTMQLFVALGWATANAFYEACAPDKATAAPHLRQGGRGRPGDYWMKEKRQDARTPSRKEAKKKNLASLRLCALALKKPCVKFLEFRRSA